MGRVGRSAVKALYARQYANADVRVLTVALEAALWALLDIVCHAAPRSVELTNVSPKRSLVYADAFVKVGERNWCLADGEEFAVKFQQDDPGREGIEVNGFGVVVFPCEENRAPLYIYGTVPKEVLIAFAPEGQYIFFLEALAQCLAIWIYWPLLRGSYWSFVDNSAAQWALTKGYSKRVEGNVLTTLFWSAAVAKKCEPWFERVPSKANCSDAISRGDTTFAQEMDGCTAQRT